MTEYFVAKNVANMMSKPDPDSGLVSQAIAGTIVLIEKTENDYCYVQTPDLYHGWIAKRRLIPAWDRSAYETVMVKTLFADVYAKPEGNSPLLTKLVLGTRLPISSANARNNVDQNTGQNIQSNNISAQSSASFSSNIFIEVLLPDKQPGFICADCLESWQDSQSDEVAFEEKWRSSKRSQREEMIAGLGKKVVTMAKCLMGTPYLWGGGTPFGMDCSGMTQLTYKLNGVQLLRDSYMQYDDCRFNKIERDKALENAVLQAGDLLVFDIKQKGKIDHIGIACGDGTFIQTRGEMLDAGVVINECTDPYYNKIYIGATRLSPQADINIAAAYLNGVLAD